MTTHTTRQLSLPTVKVQAAKVDNWKSLLVHKHAHTGAYAVSGAVFETVPLSPQWEHFNVGAGHSIPCAHGSEPHMMTANLKTVAFFGRHALCWDHWHDAVPMLRCSHCPASSSPPRYAPWDLTICSHCEATTCEEHTQEHPESGDLVCSPCSHMKVCSSEYCTSLTYTYCDTCNKPACGVHITEVPGCDCDEDDCDCDQDPTYQCDACEAKHLVPVAIWGPIEGLSPGDTNWRETWDLHESQWMNPVAACADYYLLAAMRDNLLVPGMHDYPMLRFARREAAEKLRDLVGIWDPVLIRYVDMAVGGELRYAKTVGLPKNRTRSWTLWKQLRDATGIRALLIAEREFIDEFDSGSSYGGPAWATIARTLRMRLTGVLTPELWLDRVFNLQHNSGTVLTKVNWLGPVVTTIDHELGPAHSSDPPRWRVLVRYSSPHVFDFWRYYVDDLRRACRDERTHTPRLPQPSDDEHAWYHLPMRQFALTKPYSDYIRTGS